VYNCPAGIVIVLNPVGPLIDTEAPGLTKIDPAPVIAAKLGTSRCRVAGDSTKELTVTMREIPSPQVVLEVTILLDPSINVGIWVPQKSKSNVPIYSSIAFCQKEKPYQEDRV
jgi:hypothetical protein